MTERIPIGDFKIGARERELVERVLDSDRLSEWKTVREFEEKFAEYEERKRAIAFNSGTSAEMCVFEALKHHRGLKPGDKVLTNPLTFSATVNSMKLTGFEPEFVDIDLETLNLSTEGVKEFFENPGNQETCRVITPVFLMGLTANISEIEKLANQHNQFLFNDCAQSHSAMHKGKKVGSFGDASAFSFYISHNIQAGEMGAIATDDLILAEHLNKLKSYGKNGSQRNPTPEFSDFLKQKGIELEDVDARFIMEFVGFNFRTTELTAAIGIAQLEKADETKKKRQENFKFLCDGLERHSGILRLLVPSDENDYLGFPVIIEEPGKISRKKLRDCLEENGVETRPLFGCIPFHQPNYVYKKKAYEGKLPNALHAGENGFYFGCHQYLSSENLEAIVKAFDSALKGL